MDVNPSTDPSAVSSRACRWFAALMGSYAMAGGMLTLVGWFAHLPALTDWQGNRIPMFANTAFAAVCTGAALMLQCLGGARSRVPVGILASVAALLGGA